WCAGLLRAPGRTARAGGPGAAQLPGLQPAGRATAWLDLPARRQAGGGAGGRQPRLQRRRAAVRLGQAGPGHRLALDLGNPGRTQARRTGDRARRVRTAGLRHSGGLSAATLPAGQGALLHRLPEGDLQRARLLGNPLSRTTSLGCWSEGGCRVAHPRAVATEKTQPSAMRWIVARPKIATFNINGIRARRTNLLAWLL